LPVALVCDGAKELSGTAIAISHPVGRSFSAWCGRIRVYTLRVLHAPEVNMNVITRLRALVRHEEGQDLIEYALLVALISLVAVVAITNAGSAVNNIFSSIAGKLQGAL
jgi:pilus assembly protein Flp/PilA